LPWHGRTLSLTGQTPGYPTMGEARATGFRHPNCRCDWYSDVDGRRGGGLPARAVLGVVQGLRAGRVLPVGPLGSAIGGRQFILAVPGRHGT
jgi:hypothetical protein